MKKLLLPLILCLLFLMSSCSSDSDDYEGTSSRCVATTKAGSQCKRNADKGSSYCWQHKK